MNDIDVYPPGKLIWREKEFVCAVGRSGVSEEKKEGDGATPVGRFPIRKVFFRADRLARPAAVFPLQPISPDDGWCDDPKDENYNRLVKLPCPASHELMWLEEHLYDIVVVLGYNDDPPVPEKGSAIFVHVAKPDYGPTEGCVALALSDLIEIIETASINTQVCIHDEKRG